ncbi:MAG: hypothetical protein ACXAE3_08585 [Candidatus Kariarchaeaceae archaeon]|jgi:hypothetical protein
MTATDDSDSTVALHRIERAYSQIQQLAKLSYINSIKEVQIREHKAHVERDLDCFLCDLRIS